MQLRIGSLIIEPFIIFNLFLIMSGNTKFFQCLIICFIVTIFNILLARFAAITYAPGPGSFQIYFAVAFMIAFTLWFGLWGAIAAYLGCFIGAGILAGIPITVSLYWSLADFWQVILPLVAFKEFKGNIGLKTKRDVFIFLGFGVVFNNAIGAAWGASMFAIGGVISWNEVSSVFLGWFISNMIITMVITTLLLRYITPHLQKTGLNVQKYWL